MSYNNMEDKLIIGGHEFTSRFILGSGKYDLDLIRAAVECAGAQMITLALRRVNTNGDGNILDYIPEGVTLPLSVFIRVTDDDEIRTINREQRGKDAATDVLSFPTVNYPAGKTAGACEALLREEFDPDTDACAIGDIVISMDHVRAQAAEYGHSERRECGYLLTHGLFHLMGYDHMTEAEKPVMRAMEEKALASIGLTREE